MNPQPYFNLLITEGFYNKDWDCFMCHSIIDALREGFLSVEIANALERAIQHYLRELCPKKPPRTLHTALTRAGILPERPNVGNTFEICLPIYQNWARRPYTQAEYLTLVQEQVK